MVLYECRDQPMIVLYKIAMAILSHFAPKLMKFQSTNEIIHCLQTDTMSLFDVHELIQVCHRTLTVSTALSSKQVIGDRAVCVADYYSRYPCIFESVAV
jgi:hypothetical protein